MAQVLREGEFYWDRKVYLKRIAPEKKLFEDRLGKIGKG